MKIGVISDTHNFFDPNITAAFRGVEHILHAGDIGLPHILRELERLAPVTAVSGNTDESGFHYRETATVTLAKKRFLIHHIVTPHRLSDSLEAMIAREQPDIVIFGHTHKPVSEYVGQMLYFNPGYAGKSRFGMERSVALLNYDEQGLRWDYVPLT